METEKIIADYFAHISEEVWEKAAKIKLIITDIDGVMTDGGILYDDNKLEFKKFNVKDGLIVYHLRKSDFIVGAITGRESYVVQNRCEELKFDFHYHGVKNKGKKFDEVLETLELEAEEVAFIGDDLIDLQILARVGFAVVPSDAVEYVKPFAHYVSRFAGGKGVFREVGDLLLHAKGLLVPIIHTLSHKENDKK
ncbi:3-deoxy-D-manno-octulosonate 8-phosphate phosphatase (KDO 8-P phosphatase) [Algoriphagus ratkowskyi]|uniref:3-deoxy-D-manno-octulosonate 8-phosphate phosphatase (KDO 8-P phosphatase) n=1 Tax=Algoriphagus ratkowskyi TaxID=57028 RepID=A0A2W7RLI3_9BACT|nr:HAD hydrolase family protein [Algoriphagus ratkowskyi]PZX61111.1 3-deoxy-D-manno-octulosonate 8-phosphate phosphatase (KDO 8-P phosphatase) [Algoriphagus ratkowskyi]TXD79241.1 3-deoxy-manno-octulosonate-8-phosphatase [Algoriphagus ratkowskyi]